MASPFGRLRTVRHAAYGAASVVLIGAGAFLMATPAQAATTSPWWHLTSGGHPSVLPEAGGKGDVVVTAANLGDAITANGEIDPVVVEDTLPPHLKALSIEAVAGGPQGPLNRGPVSCKKATLTCTFKGTLAPYDQIEVRVGVETLPGAQSGETNEVRASGGGAVPLKLTRPLQFGPGPVPFGVEAYELSPEEEGGGPTTHAGSHPFQLTTTISLDQVASGSGIGYQSSPAALAKDIDFHWPAGLIGDPSPVPRCSLAQFLTRVSGGAFEVIDACPADTAVGVVMITIEEQKLTRLATFPVPLFNLDPAFGEPARIGFYVGSTNTPVIIDPALRSGNGEDYGVDVKLLNTTESVGFLASQATVWGVPGDPRHDNSRGWGCLYETREAESSLPCKPSEEPHPPAFLACPPPARGKPSRARSASTPGSNPTT